MLYEVITLWNRSLRRKVDERTASLQSAMEELSRNQQQLRITSYNVCYTKLLRKVNGISDKNFIAERVEMSLV